MALLSFLVFAFACAVTAASSSNSTTLALGQACNTASPQCAPGVSCYAVNSMEIPTCGSFQGTCTTTSQCATNECVNGFCAGSVLPSLGSQCTPLSESASALPCAFGASCYAVNSMEITVCGNLEAECSWDGQCAYNQCQGGFCNGALLSSASSTSSPSYGAPTTSSSFSIYYPANSTSSTPYLPFATGTGHSTTGNSTTGNSTTGNSTTGNSTTGLTVPTTSVLYVNGTATGSNTQVTSTLIVGGKTSIVGGETTFRQGPSQTASVQSSSAGKAAIGAGALGMVGVVMLLL